MFRTRWLIGVGLATLLAVGAAAGYELAPTVVSAAQHREASVDVAATATPTPPGKQPAVRQARPFLGVQVSDGDGGAQITNVLAASPAASAGLQRGDTVTAVNGSAVTNAAQLVQAISAHKPGDKTSLAIKRGGASQNIEVTLGTTAARRAAVPHAMPMPQVPNPLGSLGGLLPELRNLPADQRFDHFRGGTFSYTDKNNAAVTVSITPGVVTAVTTDTVTLRPNGASADASFSIGDGTQVFPGGRAQVAQTIKACDKIVVTARQGATPVLSVFDVTAATQRRGPMRPNGPALPGHHFSAPNGTAGQSGLFGDLGKRLQELRQHWANQAPRSGT